MKRLFRVFLGAVLTVGLFGCSASPAQNNNSQPEPTVTQEIHASDYSDSGNWLSVPAEIIHDADVIYFYPTCYFPQSEDDPRICTINNADMREGARTKLLDQASAFETSCNIFAPYYRQVDAMSLAGLSQEEMLEVESAEPKVDVFAALDYYFENYNQGRPFVLAGHSQGSMMLQLILGEYLEDHPEYYERMVAAYMIGNAATTSWLAENPHLVMAQRADDTGVIVSWNTEGPGNAGQYNMVAPNDSVCINPLNWKTDETPASISENGGTLIQDDTGNYVVASGIADARIDLERGTVICDSVDPSIYAMPAVMAPLFGSESYHGWDYKFYYQNIRENAEVRVKAYLDNLA